MDFNKLYEEMIWHKNEEQAQKMSKYMLNKFEYIGIKTPERREIFKNFFKEYKNEEKIDWEFVNKCWENEYREFQYVAADYLKNMKDKLTIDDIPKFKRLILEKSWWDTIDNLDMTIGALALKDSNVNKILLEWSIDENIWLRRIAIDHQLLRKEKTNTELLEKILKNNLGQVEFFINKAIGWALRDYSKTNSEWVKNFIEENEIFKDNALRIDLDEIITIFEEYQPEEDREAPQTTRGQVIQPIGQRALAAVLGAVGLLERTRDEAVACIRDQFLGLLAGVLLQLV